MSKKNGDPWAEAARRCRLSAEDIRMARALGFQPSTLNRNIPSRSERWKAPVNEWVRMLFEQKFGRHPEARPAPRDPPPGAGPGPERRNAEDPWPDRPEVKILSVPYVDPPFDEDGLPDFDAFPPALRDDTVPPTADEIEEQDAQMLGGQIQFRQIAQLLAQKLAGHAQVQKLAAFGSAAQPLCKEDSHDPRFRRHRTRIFHRCGDLDLAAWLSAFDGLEELRKTVGRTLDDLQFVHAASAAHHEMDLHLFDAANGAYRGRLCNYRECPKRRRPECRVSGCGSPRYLRQLFAGDFDPLRFAAEPKVVLFDRAGGFLVRRPEVREPDVAPVFWQQRLDDPDVPF